MCLCFSIPTASYSFSLVHLLRVGSYSTFCCSFLCTFQSGRLAPLTNIESERANWNSWKTQGLEFVYDLEYFTNGSEWNQSVLVSLGLVLLEKLPMHSLGTLTVVKSPTRSFGNNGKMVGVDDPVANQWQNCRCNHIFALLRSCN